MFPSEERTGDFKRVIAGQKAHALSIAVHKANQLIKSRDLGILPASVFESLSEQLDEVARLCYSLTRVPPKPNWG